MNLDKAVELNKESEKSLRDGKHPDHADAVKIGNEAIELLQYSRRIGSHYDPTSLPTETKE